MGKCKPNGDEIFKELSGIDADLYCDFITRQEAEQQYKELFVKFAEMYDKRGLTEAVLRAASELGIRNKLDLFFSDDKVKFMLENGGKADIAKAEDSNTEKLLIEAQRNKKRNDVSSRFLSDAYGIATNVKEAAQRDAAINIVMSCIANWKDGYVVSSFKELNENITAYQERLIGKIIEFIQTKYNELGDKSKYPGNPEEDFEEFYNKRSGLYQLYWTDDHGNLIYTGIIERLEKYCKIELNPGSINANELMKRFERAKQNTVDGIQTKEFLEAYNAWQVLTHFDSLMDVLFGKSLIIDHFGDCQFDFPNKYSFNTKGDANKTSWRGKDEINLSEDVSKLVQTIISCIPVIDWRTGHEIEGAYLNLNKLQSVLHNIKNIFFNSNGNINIKIKELKSYLTKKEIKTIKLYGRPKHFSGGLDKNNINFVKLVNNMGDNPQDILPVIVKILLHDFSKSVLNQKIKPYLNNTFKFDDEFLNTLYSLNEYVFKTEHNEGDEVHSLYDMTCGPKEGSYYSAIASTCNSIFQIDFSQYFKDSSNNLHLRRMNAGEIEKSKRIVENGIKIQNSRYLENYSDHKEKFGGKLNYNKDKSVKDFIINIEGLKIECGPHSAATISHNRGYTDKQKAKLLEFINTILNQSLTNDDIEKMINLGLTGGVLDPDEMYKNLTLLAADVYFMSAVSNEFLRDKDGNLIKNKAKIRQELSNFMPAIKFDNVFQDINIVRTSIGESNRDNKNFPTMNAIATYLTYQAGTLNSNVIKNGEGNSQNSATLGRLLNRVQQQWQGHIIDNDDAAAKDFSILNPEIFEGISVCLEYSDGDTVKSNEKFTLAEFIRSGFINNFISGMENNDSYNDVAGNGHIMISASVNSDKKTIDMLRINTRQQVTLKRTATEPEEKIYISALMKDTKKMMRFIEQEIGSYYRNAVENIQNDFNRLTKWAIETNKYEKTLHLPNFLNGDINFADFNANFVNPQAKLEELVSEYNDTHPTNPIQLIDQVHWITEKGKIYANQTLLSCYYRFNPQYRPLLDNGINKYGSDTYPTHEEFWDEQRKEVVKSIIRSKTKFDLTADETGMYNLNKRLSSFDTISDNPNRRNWNKRPRYANAIAFVKGATPGAVELVEKDIYSYKGGVIYVDKEKGGYYITTTDQLPSKPDNLIIHPYSPTTVKRNIANTLGSFELKRLLENPVKNKDKINSIINELGEKMNLTSDDYKLFKAVSEIGKKYGKDAKLTFDDYIPTSNEWKDDSTGYMIIAKAIRENGEEVPIISNELPEDIVELKLNPLLEEYMLTDYLFSQEFMISTVGSCVAHPVKGSQVLDPNDPKDETYTPQKVFEEEAARFQAQHKRNVSFTATMHRFQLNQLDGIPTYYNIAVIDDLKDDNYNVSGVSDNTKTFDGATFVNPFIVYLENNSLNAARAGYTKKQFVHYYDARTGTGGIIKTCGFALMNTTLINSRLHRNLFKKMADRKWIDESGNEVWRKIDITKDWRGDDIEYNASYMVKNGKLQMLDTIYKNEDGTYTVTYVEVDENGDVIYDENDNEIETTEIVNIRSNYELWKVFGGYNSIEIIDGKLNRNSVSENSIMCVVQAMNNIGFNHDMTAIEINPETGEPIEIDPETNEQIDRKITTQDDMYQPLKHADIHYMPTVGAVKQGAANINSNDVYYDKSTDIKFMRIKMDNAGIQLDKEHHATEAELALMTQVISACAQAGFTYEYAMEIYKGLANLAQIRTKELYDAYIKSDDSPGDYTDFVTTVVQTVVKEMAKDNYDENSTLYILARDLIDKVKSGQKLTAEDVKHFPIDNNAVLPQFISKLSVFLSKAGIKIKEPGVLAVLTPSHESFKLYDVPMPDAEGNFTLNKTVKLQEIIKDPVIIQHVRDQIKAENEIKDDENVPYPTEEQIIDYLQSFKLPVTKTSEIRIRKTYKTVDFNNNVVYYQINLPGDQTGTPKMVDGKLVFPIGYTAFKKKWHEFKNVQEDITAGRNLLSANFIFNEEGNSNETFQLYDLYSIQAMFDLRDTNINDFYRNYVYGKKEIEDKLYNGYAGPKISLNEINNLLKFNDPDGKLFKALEPIFREKVRNDLCQLSEAGSQFVPQQPVKVIALDENHNLVEKDIIVDKKTVKSEDYEVIMPKIFKEEFGLDTFDQLSDVVSDPDYFFKKAKNNLNSHLDPGNYDIELKNTNGKHIYLIDKKNSDARLNGFTNIGTMQQLRTIYDNGKLSRLDRNGNILYPVSNTEDEVWYKDGVEVIVTDNVEFYMDNIKYDFLKFSSEMNIAQMQHLWNNNINKKNSTGDYDTKNFNSKRSVINMFDEWSRSEGKGIVNINEFFDNFEEKIDDRILQKQCVAKHNCFLKQLEILAARIPAQSMQSFMKMKIVAFDDLDINTAYVNTDQIWLEGSDYDVDAVSLATYAIDKAGTIPLWSDYADYTSSENLEKSFQIEFPTGEKLEREKITEDDYKAKPNETQEKIINLWNLLDKFTRNICTDENGNSVPFVKFTNTKNHTTVELKEREFDLYNELIRNGKLLYELSDDIAKRFINSIKDENHPLKNLTVKQLQRLITTLADKVDTHNMYLNDVSQQTLEQIQINRNHYYILKIISDPSNFIQHQMSVDNMTAEPKYIGNTRSVDSKLVKRRNPGNPFNKYESIRENQVGKDGIAICAVGLKGFFALTEYINNAINKDKDGSAIKNTSFNIQLTNINGKPLNFRFISGMNVKEEVFNTINSVYDFGNNTNLARKYFDSFLQAKTQTDAALMLSALLSLATDNAKELQLAKLNAGINTLGMYLYGLSIGMSFDEISGLMMSPIGRMINDVMESGNVFTGEQGAFSLENVFDYFQIGPRKMFDGYSNNVLSGLREDLSNIFAFELDEKGWIKKDAQEKYIIANNSAGEPKFPIEYTSLPIYKLVAAIAWNKEYELNEKLELIGNLKSRIFDDIQHGNYDELNNNKRREIQLLNAIEKYIKQVDVIKKNEQKYNPKSGKMEGTDNFAVYNSLKIIAFGANEMRELGSILSLNQGLSTKHDEIIGDVQKIEDILTHRRKVAFNEKRRNTAIEKYKNNAELPKKEEQFKESPIDLIKFCRDSEYRTKQIAEYQKNKHTFNILECVVSNPHFNEYLKLLAEQHESFMKASAKYKFMYDYSSLVINKINAYKREHKDFIRKRLGDYYNDYLINQWFRTQTNLKFGVKSLVTSEKIDKKRKKDEYFDLDFSKNSLRATQNQIATFKYIMENEIIPKLKKIFKNNKFIQDLKPRLLNHTIGNNAISHYALEANMMPKTDADITRFNIYKSELNELSGKTLSEFTEGKNAIKIKILGKDIALSDLFYMYGLVAHYGKQGRQSIMPLFINLNDSGLISDFHKFEGIFSQEYGIVVDSSENAKEGIIANTRLQELMDYCTPKDSIYTSNLSQVYYQDPNTMEWDIWRRKSYEELKQEAQDAYDGENGVYRIGKILNYDKRTSIFTESFLNQYNMYGYGTFGINSQELSIPFSINSKNNSNNVLLNLTFDEKRNINKVTLKINLKEVKRDNKNKHLKELFDLLENNKDEIKELNSRTKKRDPNKLNLQLIKGLILNYINGCK